MDLYRRARRAYEWGGPVHVVKSGTRLLLQSIPFPSLLDLSRVPVLNIDGLVERCREGETLWYLDEMDDVPQRDDVDLIPLGYTENHRHFVKTKYFTYPREFVCVLENTRILGPMSLVLSQENEIVKTTVSTVGNDDEKLAFSKSVATNPWTTISTFMFGSQFSGDVPTYDVASCLFLNQNAAFYTWVLFELLKLRGVERYRSETGLKPTLIIPPSPPKFVKQSIRHFGYTQEDWVEWSGPATDVRELVVPIHPEPKPTNLQWLRERGTQDDTTGEPGGKYVYYSRAKSGRRKVENEEAVTEMLESLGFERYFGEELTFSEQVSLFASADVVVAPHGAGLSNIVWSTDVSIVEMFNDFVTDPFYLIADSLGHEYTAIQGSSVDPTARHSDFHVDTDQLQNVIRQQSGYSQTE
jgi:hypothetical protein